MTPDPDPAEAVAAFLAGDPHGWRYRQLVDPGHPDHDPRYWPLVARRAGVPDAPPPGADPDRPLFLSAPQPDPARYRRALAAATRCPYGDPTDWDVAGCGCGSSRRCWRLARKVAPSECVACIGT